MVALFLTHHILFQFDATGSMRYIEYPDHSSSRPPSEQPDGKSIKTKTQVLTRLCFQLRQLESIIILSTEIVLAKRMSQFSPCCTSSKKLPLYWNRPCSGNYPSNYFQHRRRGNEKCLHLFPSPFPLSFMPGSVTDVIVRCWCIYALKSELNKDLLFCLSFRWRHRGW